MFWRIRVRNFKFLVTATVFFGIVLFESFGNTIKSLCTLKGRNFLFNCQRDWTRGTTFSHHIWWHSALFHVQLGEFQVTLLTNCKRTKKILE